MGIRGKCKNTRSNGVQGNTRVQPMEEGPFIGEEDLGLNLLNRCLGHDLHLEDVVSGAKGEHPGAEVIIFVRKVFLFDGFVEQPPSSSLGIGFGS